MDRRIKGGVRASATAVGVAAGLMILASTAQTPDGFIYAGFGGPLDVFSPPTADVFAIGDGASDATELAALLRAPGVTSGSGTEPPYRVSVEAGSTPSATTVNVFPTTDPVTAGGPATQEAATTPAKPVIDGQGRVDCSGSVSCDTDPLTKVTTVTYPDGVVAMVQKVNNLTVVAYKALERLPVAQNLTPPLPAQSVAPLTAPTREQLVEASPNPPVLPPPPQSTVSPVDPGPPAPDPVPPVDDILRGPKVTVTPPPPDFGRNDDFGDDLPKPNVTKPTIPGLGKVKDALDSAVEAIRGAVGSAVNPGASDKPDNPGNPGTESSDTGKSGEADGGNNSNNGDEGR